MTPPTVNTAIMTCSPSPPGSSSIQVVVRLRPMNDKEKKDGTLAVVTASTQDKTVTVIKGTGLRQVRSSFNFDHVFTAFSTQEEVFDATLKPVIDDVMNGYESTVFAYGQTGTGKTYTMEGDLDSPDMHGVIPRSAQAIFETLGKPQYTDHSVTCSYLEIYNEELCDLLSDEASQHGRIQPGTSKLEIMEGKNGTFCRGLVEKEVGSAEDVIALMNKAQNQRRIGETKMNKQSSRSHCIFTVTVQTTNKLMDGNESMKFHGKLHLVDLAGSECAKTSSLDKGCNTELARERERMNINRSLLTLGRVISMLKEQSENKKAKHNVRIPYRDSKLTRILQESLGGRCKCVIVATLSPSLTAIEESISTLNYAQSANGIINKPVSTSYLSITPRGAIQSGGFTSESAASDQGNTVEHWHEVECRLQYMQAQVEEAQAALARKHMQQQELVERVEKAEADRLEIEQKYCEASIQVKSLETQLSEELALRKQVQSHLKATKFELRKTTTILKATQQTEVSLTSEAENLLRTLKESIVDGDTLHRLLVEHKKIESDKKNATANFQSATVTVLEETLSSLSDISSTMSKFCEKAVLSAEEDYKQGQRFMEETETLLKEIVENVNSVTSSMKSQMRDDGGAISTLHATSSLIQSGVDGLSNTLLEGENRLSKSCTSARNQLETHVKLLSQLEATHSKSSEDSLSVLESSVSSSRAKIASMIALSTKALADARNARAEAMNAHKKVLSEWKAYSTEKAKAVEQTAAAHRENVSGAIDFFTGEMCHHESMNESLSSQLAFLTENGNAHVSGIAKQQTMIDTQESTLIEHFKVKEQLHEECMRKIMQGVQNLVSEQMKLLEKRDKQHFDVLTETSLGLKQNNEAVDHTAKHIIQEISGTNASLTNFAKTVHQNDLRVMKVMEETSTTLSEIEKVSNDHRDSTTSMATTAAENMEMMTAIDADTENILEAITRDGNDCSNHLATSVLKETKQRIECLASSGEDICKYSSTNIIPDALSALENIQFPRKDITKCLNDGLNQTRDHVLIGCKKVIENVEKQCVASSHLYSDVLEKENVFVSNVVSKHGDQLNSQKDALIVGAAEFDDKTSAKLSASSANTKEVQNQIHNYATTIIRVQDVVPPVSSRTVHEFGEQFTSTPSDKVILEGIDLNDESNDENKILVDQGYNSDYNDHCLGKGTDIDRCSRAPNPKVLMERSLNKENIAVDDSSNENTLHREIQSSENNENIGISQSMQRKRKAKIGETPPRKNSIKRHVSKKQLI